MDAAHIPAIEFLSAQKGTVVSDKSIPHQPCVASRIPAVSPPCVIKALSNRSGQYTDFYHVFHCIQVDVEWWVGVVDDGDNGRTEWFSFKNGGNGAHRSWIR